MCPPWADPWKPLSGSSAGSGKRGKARGKESPLSPVCVWRAGGQGGVARTTGRKLAEGFAALLVLPGKELSSILSWGVCSGEQGGSRASRPCWSCATQGPNGRLLLGRERPAHTGTLQSEEEERGCSAPLLPIETLKLFAYRPRQLGTARPLRLVPSLLCAVCLSLVSPGLLCHY